MLAYESLEKCNEDLLAYKLNIQTVSTSISNTTTTATETNSGCISSALTKASSNTASNLNNSHSIKSTSSIKTQPNVVVELILDCKSCSIQNL